MSGERVNIAAMPGTPAWFGRDLQDDPSWILRFDADAIAEIDAALSQVKRTTARIPYPAEAFPLPRLKRTLDAVRDEVLNGRGFVLIRGIPRTRYSDEDCALVYWGITSH